MAILRNVKKFVDANSNHILAGSAIVGLGVTAYLAIKETPRFQKAVEKAETKMDKLKAGLKAYYPAIISGCITIGCIVGLDISSLKKLEATTEALATLKKTTQLISEEKDAFEEAVEKEDPELAHTAKLDSRKSYMSEPVIRWREKWTGQEFEATELEVHDAMYEFNRRIRLNEYANVNDWLDILNLMHSQDGHLFGFNKHAHEEFGENDWVDFRITDRVDSLGKYKLIGFVGCPYSDYISLEMPIAASEINNDANVVPKEVPFD